MMSIWSEIVLVLVAIVTVSDLISADVSIEGPCGSNLPLLDVIYKECQQQLSCGQLGAEKCYSNPPKVKFHESENGKYYTLLMVDPDAPSRENPWFRYFRHWVVVNMKSSDLQSGTITGDIKTKYMGPSPPAGSGEHRYNFLVIEQLSGGFDPDLSNSRSNWKLDEFLKKYVHDLGDIVAGFQFFVRG